MAELVGEYKDIKNRTHKVDHSVLTENDHYSKERIPEELTFVLTKKKSKLQHSTNKD
ncbi:MAG: hypothetical protein ACI4JK_09230 [Oscillospiraceae bacterium]